MSLLTACKAVVGETGLGVIPATIISNTDPTAVQLNYLAERSAKNLMRFNWQAMVREHTITTADGTATYALPSDWARYTSETAWDATNYWPMRGSLDPALWQALKRGLVATSMRRRFRVVGNLVNIFPTPSSIDTLVIEYMRNTPWVNGSTYRVTATADADTTVFPEYLLELDLKWRWLEAKGAAYAEAKKEAEDEISRVQAQDVPAPTVDYGYATPRTPPFLANVPQTIV